MPVVVDPDAIAPGAAIAFRVTGLGDGALAELTALEDLCIAGCDQATLTDAAFIHLAGIHTLYMWGCSQVTITAAIVPHLACISELYMYGCRALVIAAAHSAQLPVQA
jgi:hypothetical protein